MCVVHVLKGFVVFVCSCGGGERCMAGSVLCVCSAVVM